VVTPGAPGQAPVTDYSTPYEGQYSNESVLERYLKGGISFSDITSLIAAGLVLPSVLGLLAEQPTPPTRRPYGAIGPTNWGTVSGVTGGGVNPGYIIAPAAQPAYETTNPYQAQFNWGQRPLIKTMDELPNYTPPPTPGQQAWGLQQGQQQYDLSALLNAINQAPLSPEFVGYSQYPTAGYIPPGPIAP
jgi:hypothetical protein